MRDKTSEMMMMKSPSLSSLWMTSLLVLAFAASCAKPTSTAEDGRERSAGDEGTEGASRVVHGGAIDELGITPPDSPWEEMSAFEKELYMAGKVTPVMAELFQGANAERYADFSCETCHGESMREVDFKMPTAELYPLPEPGSEAWAHLETNFPEVMSFMKETVTPAMGTLLGVEGSCLHCHTSAN